MSLLNNCENSVKYYGYFKEGNLIYLIMELCESSLDKLTKEKKFNVKEIKEILEQLNNVFKIMYDNSIIHRDIKPENILIKKLENNKISYKLTDYGFSKLLTQSHYACTFAGTLEYMAPEIKSNLNIDKSKVDLFSIGILIHKLFFGNTPKNGVIQKTNNFYLDDLIKKLLIEKPFDQNENNCRISWEDYFNHNFFKNNYKNEIENLKISVEKFNNVIKEMINFVIKKSEEFNNLIKKEMENIFTDEYNENIKNLSNLLNEFNFNDEEYKFNEMFLLINKSIFNEKKTLEYKLYLDINKSNLNDCILYEGNVIKGTNIKNGNGIEYQINNIKKDNIIFKGEYLNGKRNGKGKEFYSNGKIKFEGEYLIGERNGKGKEFYFDGKLKFEGEYLNGKRWNGKGKEDFDDGKTMFEGEYKEGEKWIGKGTEYNLFDKLLFEGEYLEGKKWNGKVNEYDFGELKFEGEYKKGEKVESQKKSFLYFW